MNDRPVAAAPPQDARLLLGPYRNPLFRHRARGTRSIEWIDNESPP